MSGSQPKNSKWKVRDPLGMWGAYFAAKGVLHLLGMLRMQFWTNAAFMVLLLLELPLAVRGSRVFSVLRGVLNVSIAAVLLWNDSWLPSLSDAAYFATTTKLPSAAYLAQFFSGYLFSLPALALAVFGLVYWRVSRTVFLTPVVCVLLLFVGFRNRSTGVERELAAQLEEFYKAESVRKVRLPTADERSGLPDIDLYFIHVCSLGFDDLNTAGLASHRFLREDLDVVFSRYNTVTSHSTPSALRLLRAPCGQTPHGELYRTPEDESCYLMESLRRAGYRTYAAYSHEGDNGGMKASVASLARGEEAPALPPLARYQVGYDGHHVFRPYDVLEAVRARREGDGAPRAVFYVNLMSLHGGGHLVGDEGWWKTSRTDLYRAFFDDLASDLERFVAQLRASGRKSAVFFVPEHGLGLRDTRVQANDLREIPLPYITVVPAGTTVM